MTSGRLLRVSYLKMLYLSTFISLLVSAQAFAYAKLVVSHQNQLLAIDDEPRMPGNYKVFVLKNTSPLYDVTPAERLGAIFDLCVVFLNHDGRILLHYKSKETEGTKYSNNFFPIFRPMVPTTAELVSFLNSDDLKTVSIIGESFKNTISYFEQGEEWLRELEKETPPAKLPNSLKRSSIEAAARGEDFKINLKPKEGGWTFVGWTGDLE